MVRSSCTCVGSCRWDLGSRWDLLQRTCCSGADPDGWMLLRGPEQPSRFQGVVRTCGGTLPPRAANRTPPLDGARVQTASCQAPSGWTGMKQGSFRIHPRNRNFPYSSAVCMGHVHEVSGNLSIQTAGSSAGRGPKSSKKPLWCL